MRKISLMYKYSGGTDYRHTCYECRRCVKKPKKQAKYQCLNYGEEDWNPAHIACKLFNTAIPVPVSELYCRREQDGPRTEQLSLKDFGIF